MDHNSPPPIHPQPKNLTRLVVLYFLVFLGGGLLGFTLRPFIEKNNSSLTTLLDSESQTKLSLKTLHDKLDQISTLQTSIDTLNQSVNHLDQAVSLINDTTALTTNVLGTASADLTYPDLMVPTLEPTSKPETSKPVRLNTQKTSQTNLYEQPALTSKSVGTWSNSQTAVTVDFQNGWYLVKLDNNSLGWVSAQLISSL
jgi:hypothetical protein